MYKTKHYLLLVFLSAFTLQGMAQDMVSYAYDQAGNRISRRIVPLNSSPAHVKKNEQPVPVEEQLGERTIKVFPNPTKGALAVDITGGDDKDELRIILYNADGKQLQNKKVEQGTTPINMSAYPVAYYILRVMAGEKMKEFKIVKN
ncbi:MAG: T9SS type A sorting domain-containing protein [Paludibacter sp.]|nr:T9SS type A sorting domain-containing protein [Paludibacter sp.]